MTLSVNYMLVLLLVTASSYLEGTTGTMTGSTTSFLGGAFGVNFGFGFAARRVRERVRRNAFKA